MATSARSCHWLTLITLNNKCTPAGTSGSAHTDVEWLDGAVLPPFADWQQLPEPGQAADCSSTLPADAQLSEQDVWPASSIPDAADPAQHAEPGIPLAAPGVRLSKDAKREDARRRNRCQHLHQLACMCLGA